ncbi:PEP-CTERM sorting domain-containing protein [Roseateles sp. BYS180W]|uniref:PEP-CTERM sorting domain-containing protein n=1 Tax=Roseateles rivi TaxID=3299028 RepID=A0ABW7FTW2_9BURK
MKLSKLCAVLGLASVAAVAQAGNPSADLNYTFQQYTSTGPVGSNSLNTNKFYWVKEATGTYNGQDVQSWVLIWDPKDAGPNVQVSGSVSFDNTILAVFTEKATLKGSSAFEKNSLSYDYSDSMVGLETVDAKQTSFAGASLNLTWNAGDPGDMVRVLTAVPEPETYALYLAGLGVVGMMARRRRTQR